LYKKQEGKCNACGVSFESRNLEIDHIVPKSKGGGDYYENYQLLCGSCNRIKGNRPMEYLRMKIETHERLEKNKVFFGE
jgi:site-specific DNA-methyltransferase (adenine-specific)